MRQRTATGILFAAIVHTLTGAAFGQAPGTPIESGITPSEDPKLIQAAMDLKEKGKLVSGAVIMAMVDLPRPEKISLPGANTKPLPPQEVYKRARRAFLRVGYLCQFEDEPGWMLDTACGYAVAPGGIVATAAHVMIPGDFKAARKGYAVALDADGRAYPITAVLAVDYEMDAAFIKVEGFAGEPLPLNENTATGEAAFCFSDPLHLGGYFSSGLINRFYWGEGVRGDPATFDGLSSLRMTVGTDWAPGSSGAAILDACGNAIGHVVSILPVGEDMASWVEETPGGEEKQEAPAADLSVAFQQHDGAPARALKSLAGQMARPAPPPTVKQAAELIARMRWVMDLPEALAMDRTELRTRQRQFSRDAAELRREHPDSPLLSELKALEIAVDMTRDAAVFAEAETLLEEIAKAATAPETAKSKARKLLRILRSGGVVPAPIP